MTIQNVTVVMTVKRIAEIAYSEELHCANLVELKLTEMDFVLCAGYGKGMQRIIDLACR